MPFEDVKRRTTSHGGGDKTSLQMHRRPGKLLTVVIGMEHYDAKVVAEAHVSI